MATQLRGRNIKKIGVVGSGQIGPDIAFHFLTALASQEAEVVIVDISQDALDKGRARIEKKIAKSVKNGTLDTQQAEALNSRLSFTSNYDALERASLVVEAATEDAAIKRRIVRQVEEVCAVAVIASNSSHMEPEVIFAEAADASRCLVIHYFFPADRNKIVEVVGGDHTDPALLDDIVQCYNDLGKVPIRVGSRYGYAVDPVFEGLFLASALMVEAGMGSVREIDAAVKNTLGMGVGPFTAMNLTGGNPITDHGLDQMHTKINAWYRSPKLLKDQLASGEPWSVAAMGEEVETEELLLRKVQQTILGAYYGMAGEIIDSGIISPADMDRALATALVIRPPFAWINDLGVKTALQWVRDYAELYPEFVVPKCIEKHAASGTAFQV